MNLNSNLLILIPKTPGADSIDNFRPIALANFQFKIITKILADRLSVIASKIISPQQRGFIPDRHISDCVIVASEAINVLQKKRYGGNLALKIDIKKAFDSIDWPFLLSVLHQFGFSIVFCDWIREILHSARLSILINGKAVGYFNCTRGVRQGDPLSPLSPLLFCIAEEVLSRTITQASADGRLKPMRLCRGVDIPTHVLYADDIMIFCQGSKRNIRHLMRIFEDYDAVSGQVINKQKSKFYTGAISNARYVVISNLLGFSPGSVPFTYLGCPIFTGRPKVIHFQSIADKIKLKLSSWKGSLLSIMGRVQLVKSIIHGMLVYSFHVYLWPRSLLKKLEKWIRNFIWSGDINTKKICTVAWKKVCTTYDAGGLDLRPLDKINSSLMLQLCWKFLSSDEQWASLCRAKYLRHGKPVNTYVKSSIWYGIKHHVSTVKANTIWLIGSGQSVFFWTDNWLGTPLVYTLNVQHADPKFLTTKVAKFINHGRWRIPKSILELDHTLGPQINKIILPKEALDDRLIWTSSQDGLLNAKKAYFHLFPSTATVAWAVWIWHSFIPPSSSFVVWRALHDRLPTDENLIKRGCTVVSVCSLCLAGLETTSHLFLSCSFAAQLWNWLGTMFENNFDCTNISCV
jgi:hypothetical protein